MLKRILGALILLIVAAVAVVAWLMRPLDENAAMARWMSEEDRLVTVEGETWRVRESGPEDAPALVLIHGFSHSLETWEAWADELEGEYRVIRFDLPGHGLTGPRADAAYSVPETVAQVSALLDAVAPDSFALGGSSLGGLVAWRYAADHPERVSALVLVSPGGYPNLGVGDAPAPVPDAVKLFLTLAPEPGVAQATAALYADPSRITEDQLARIRDLMRVRGVGDALIQRIEQFTLPDPNPDLRRIEAPTLVLWGAADAMIPPQHAPRFGAAIPNAQVQLVPDAGHMPMEEQAEATAQAVRAFLAEAR